MKHEKAYGPHPRKSYQYRELPIGSTSIGVHDDVIKTGLWRVFRPVFVEKTPPCSEACPAGVDVRGFISLMKQGLSEEAHKLYLEENPFPAICGRVCDHPCEDVCNRKDFDQPVAINALERFVADFESQIQPDYPMNGGRVAVVGSGPAGLSCSYYLSRLGHRVTVFEAMAVVGGLLRTGIPAYRLPVEVVEKEVEKLRAMGVRFETQHPINQEDWKDLEKFDALLLAYGAGMSVPFAFPHDDDIKQRIISGLDFLETAKMTLPPLAPQSKGGIGEPSKEFNSHPFGKGEVVNPGDKIAVVGGGNTAIDAARVAVRLGASPTVIYRRSRAEMPAFKSEVDDALEEGVEILFLTTPTGIERRADRMGIRCISNRLTAPDGDGRPFPVPIEGTDFTLEIDTVISAIGEIPDLSFFPGELELAARSVPVDEMGSTGQPGVFACGDLTAQPRSVAHAIGSGKRAAIAIDCYLRKQPGDGLLNAYKIGEKGNISFRLFCDSKVDSEQQKETLPKSSTLHDAGSQGQGGDKQQVGTPPRQDGSIPSIPSHQVARFEDLNPGYFHYQERFERGKIPVEDRKGFEEICGNLTVENALDEAQRCFSCGSCCLCDNCYLLCPDGSVVKDEPDAHHVINYEYCKGCGICENECPSGAIEMERET